MIIICVSTIIAVIMLIVKSSKYKTYNNNIVDDYLYAGDLKYNYSWCQSRADNSFLYIDGIIHFKIHKNFNIEAKFKGLGYTVGRFEKKYDSEKVNIEAHYFCKREIPFESVSTYEKFVKTRIYEELNNNLTKNYNKCYNAQEKKILEDIANNLNDDINNQKEATQ